MKNVIETYFNLLRISMHMLRIPHLFFQFFKTVIRITLDLSYIAIEIDKEKGMA